MATDGCGGCGRAAPLDLDFTFAFQPIVQWSRRRVFAYEALIRGVDGSGAGSILSRVTPETRYAFDQRARTGAIALASELFRDDGSLLSINTLPNAIYDPRRCLRSTLLAARAHGFPLSRLMFEMTEDEEVLDVAHLKRIASYYSTSGFTTAIDDFGKSFSTLEFFMDFKPHVLKLDMSLVQGADRDADRRARLRTLLSMTTENGVRIVAEGVETIEELAALVDLGFDLFQGYLFARPGFRSLPTIAWDSIADGLATATPAAPAVVRRAAVG
jgi:EAL domain-containing protein (putative c-di-GMP-specific phosphodiesterase class I)